MNRVIVISALCLGLTGCLYQSEQSKQQEAVEYQIQQHDSAKCADQGLLPGSDPFNTCMRMLETAPQPAQR
jgi:hypothetical protein